MTIFKREDGSLFDWPDCAVPGCPNQSCLRLNSKYCWPHTPGSADEARRNLEATEPQPEAELSSGRTTP